MKPAIRTLWFVLLLPVSLYSQSGNINNTLGTGGMFTIKDGSNTFFSLSQSNGYLSLNKCLTLPATTSSTVGVIFKGANRFIHDYAASGTSGYNTFVGVNSGNFTMSGTSIQASFNTSVGNSSLSSVTTGCYNSALGAYSLWTNTTGYYNSAFGYFSLGSNTGGYVNSAFGLASLQSNTTGYNNSAFGNQSLSNSTGDDNSAFGNQSLQQNTTGNDNSAFGFNSLSKNTASGSSAFGSQSLYSNTTGSGNSAFGHYSLYNNVSTGNNSAFGYFSLYANTGNNNSAFGYSSLMNNTASWNSAFGYQSLYKNTSGTSNSAFGNNSLYANTTGAYNSAFGYSSLTNNTASNNSAFGWYALYMNTSSNNSAFGEGSLYSNTGTNNSAFGYNAGYNITSGTNNTCIGYNAQPSSATVINEITLGNSSIQYLRCQVTTISGLSDARDKKNIKDLPLGLEFLMNVKPRMFNWDRRDWYKDGKPNGSKMQTAPTAGFIAQELDEVQTKEGAEWLNLVLKSNPNRLEATPGNLLPIVVKAIQELKTENDALKAKLARLEQAFVTAMDRIRSESSGQHTESGLTQE